MSTPILGIDEVEEGQGQKHITINAAFRALELMAGATEVVMTTDHVLTAAQNRGGCLALSGTLTADRVVQLASGIERWFMLYDTVDRDGFTLSLKVGSGGTPLVLSPGPLSFVIVTGATPAQVPIVTV